MLTEQPFNKDKPLFLYLRLKEVYKINGVNYMCIWADRYYPFRCGLYAVQPREQDERIWLQFNHEWEPKTIYVKKGK